MSNEVWASESDAYFQRNREVEKAFTTDALQEYFYSLDLKGKKILDVGCGTGFRLAKLAERGAECFGVEPSSKAVEESKKLYSNFSITQGFSHKLPFEDFTFDVVFINLVLCWVLREKLLSTIAEMDRVLKDGGLLIIGDFYPNNPHKRGYKHKEGISTYKQNNWEILTASNLYSIIDKIPYLIGTKVRNDSLKPGDDMAINVVLRKNLEGNYPLRDLK